MSTLDDLLLELQQPEKIAAPKPSPSKVSKKEDNKISTEEINISLDGPLNEPQVSLTIGKTYSGGVQAPRVKSDNGGASPKVPALALGRKAQDWLDSKTPEITDIITKISEFKSYSLEDPSSNLGKIHLIASEIREKQTYVRTYLVKSIAMQLEAQRMLDVVTRVYKDEIADALDKYKEDVANARSFEEREIRLRKKIPSVVEKEDWTQTLNNVLLLRDAIQRVYDDLSKASMTLAMQINVLKQQILVGEVKIIIPASLVKTVLSDGTAESIDRVEALSAPSGGKVSI